MKFIRHLKILFTWVVFSILLQFSFYALADFKAEQVFKLTPSKAIDFILPSALITNIKISYSNNYAAYLNSGTLEIYDTNKSRVVYRKKPPTGDIGIMDYIWLPDRDTLIYLYSGRNTESLSQFEKRVKDNHTVSIYTLNLNDTQPDDRYNNDIENFSSRSIITAFDVSTFTNMIYIVADYGNYSNLYEIDVMKNTKITNRSGELISNILVSDKRGEIYLESKVGTGSKQISLVDGWKRKVIETDPSMVLLGYKSGRTYLGKVKNNNLTEISVLTEQVGNNFSVNNQKLWEGIIPFTKESQSAIYSPGKILILNNKEIYLIEETGILKSSCNGKENFISSNSQSIIEQNTETDYTKLKIVPIANFFDKNITN